MPIANRLSKPQQRLHEEVMEYEVEWLPDDCCFRLQVLRYRDHWRMVCPRWFLIAELYGRPLGHGTFVLHGIFWRQVRQLTTVERCRMTQSSTGIAAFFAWLKEQETVDSKLLLAIPELRPYQIQGAHRLVKGNLLLGDDMGTGKEQPVSAEVATPSGWRRIGDLAPGDYVIGSNGQPTQVLGVYPRGVKQVYELKFSDRSTALAGAEHLWTMRYWKGGKTLSNINLTTEQLLTKPVVDGLDLSKVRLCLPMLSAPVEYGPSVVHTDPYFAGLLLANGHIPEKGSGQLTCHTDDLPHYLSSIPFSSPTTKVIGNTTQILVPSSYLEELRELGLGGVLSRDKFIPELYLRAAPAFRLKLLQGMMDGDGSCSATNNRLTYSTSSLRLAQEFRELVESLGGIASIRTYDRETKARPEYALRLRLPEWAPPFCLERKSNRYNPGKLARPARYLVSVTPIHEEESVCIAVDAPDKLYCTQHFILTHNTLQMLAALASIEKQALVVVPNDSIAWEWQAQVEKFSLPFQSLVIDRSKREDPGTFDLYFVTYAKARRPDYLQHLLKLVEGKVLILDEGHRAGRVTSQQHHACYELSENAERIWVSSGTEVSGTPDDYYGVFRLVVPCHYGPHLLVGPELWVKYFKAKGTKAWAEARLKEDLHTVRRGFGLRRTKAEVCKELPPITEIDYALPMHPIQVAQYMDMKRDLQTKVQSLYGEQELTENQFIVAYLRLMQLAAHPMLLGETRVNLTPKTERLLELVEDAGDQSVLVWSNWPDVIEWLAGHIRDKGIDCLAVHGGTSQAQRTAARDAFMERRVRCLVANPGVWGEGVNLQVASIMIDHDYHPSLSRWKQSRSRAHRIGQTLPVTSYRLYHSGSIERQILDWLQEKGRLSAIITGG